MMDYSSKRVVVMGLGRFGGGVGVSRFLVSRDAKVLITDEAAADDLRESIGRLAGLPVEFRLGEHRVEDFTSADLIVVNPAVDPRDNRYLRAAQDAGVPLTSEIRLLIEHLPDRGRQCTIGITGSTGKSTTTAMIGHILAKEHQAGRLSGRVHVGGNLGGSLLGELDQIGRDDWVVLELSSFMLQDMADASDRWSPHIAVVTNLSPNHLDRHGTLEAYARAKQEILEYQGQRDLAVLGPIPRKLLQPRTTHIHWVELWENVLGKWPIPLLIPGTHNLTNARMAIDATLCAGVDRHTASEALADFPGLPHRLQFVCEYGGAGGSGGVRFYNDSKATTPEAAELALKCFPPGTVHVILGGYERGSQLAPLARFAATHCRAIYTIGTTGDTLAAAAEDVPCDASAKSRAQVIRCGTLDGAIRAALQRVHPGDIVLLSPACASWDQFDNFEQRGSAFVDAILKYTSR